MSATCSITIRSWLGGVRVRVVGAVTTILPLRSVAGAATRAGGIYQNLERIVTIRLPQIPQKLVHQLAGLVGVA